MYPQINPILAALIISKNDLLNTITEQAYILAVKGSGLSYSVSNIKPGQKLLDEKDILRLLEEE